MSCSYKLFISLSGTFALNFDPIWFAAVIVVVQNMGITHPFAG